MQANINRSPSLSDVAAYWGLEIAPYVRKGIVSWPHDDFDGLVLDGDATRRVLAHLIATGQQGIIEHSLQGMCQTSAGVRLLTAVVDPGTGQRLSYQLGLTTLNVRLARWTARGCNEVLFHFCDTRTRAA